MKSVKFYVLVDPASVFVALLVVIVFSGVVLLAENDDRFVLQIQPDRELESLIDSHDFLKAEQLARERNLNPRIIAVLCAKNGKKEEAFRIFSDYIREAPEDRKKELAFQSINLLSHNISDEIGEELFYFFKENKVLGLSEGQVNCAEVTFLIRAGKFEEAEHKINLLLNSSYVDEENVIDAVILFVIGLRSHKGLNPETDRNLYEKLSKKFPDNLRAKLQWISSLTAIEPQKALAELDLINDRSPNAHGFNLEELPIHIHLLRAKALKSLGERERAKIEYSALIGTGFEDSARDSIKNIEAWERDERQMEQDLQEKIAQLHQPLEFPESSGRPWGIILGVNAVLIVMIIYLLYRRRKEKA